MVLTTQRRIASKILKCGENRVRFNNEKIEEIEEAITRQDIKLLIKKGVIYKIQKKGISRARVEKKKRGLGSRKGAKNSIISRKEKWIKKVRAQRKKLRELKNKRLIERSVYRDIYKMIKSGAFKSTKQMIEYLKENKLLRKGLLLQ